jgi:uncharacterized membrane protein
LKPAVPPEGDLAPSLPRRLACALALVTIFCAALYLMALDRMVYWNDEVMSSVWAAGYTRADLVRDIFRGEVLTRDELLAFEKPRPGTGVTAPVRILWERAAEHPPFYFLLLRVWMELVGDSITRTRLLSVLFGIALLPAVWWLARELFASRLAAWGSTASVAASPFFALYAREAREYSLWALLTALGSAALVRAVRLDAPPEAGRGLSRWYSWSLYALLTTLSLYTFPFALLVTASHGGYILLAAGHRRRSLAAWAVAAGAASLLFSPWALQLGMQSQRSSWVMRWTEDSKPFVRWLLDGLINASHTFSALDDFAAFDEHSPSFLGSLPFALAVTLLTIVAAALALVSAYRRAPRGAWVLLVCLFGSVTLVLVSLDLVKGGMRAVSPRYHVPGYLAVCLMLGYGFAGASRLRTTPARSASLTALGALLACGVAAEVHYLRATTAWTKVFSFELPAMAIHLNEDLRPIVLASGRHPFADANVFNLISLAHRVRPTVSFLPITLGEDGHARADAGQLRIPEGYSSVYVFAPEPWALKELGVRTGRAAVPVLGDRGIEAQARPALPPPLGFAVFVPLYQLQ